MSENLNYSDSVATPSLQKRSWCYGNEEKKCDKYGRLYTWLAAIDSMKLYDEKGVLCTSFATSCTLPDTVQGICSDGWHLPKEEEWNVLFKFVGGQQQAGVQLRAKTGCYDYGGGTGIVGLDAYGFSAMLGGYRNASYEEFSAEGYWARFWSATEEKEQDIKDRAFSLIIPCDFEATGTGPYEKKSGFYVRCIKD